MSSDTQLHTSSQWPDTVFFSQAGPALLAGALGLVGFIIAAAWNQKSFSSEPPILHGPPIIGHFRFFSERYSFVNDGLRKLGSAFQFRILNVSLYVQNVILRVFMWLIFTRD